MSINTGDNTNLRLKAVLEILADQVFSGRSDGAGAVLAEATARVPLNEREGELLSGGVPRGHKNLTTATAKLVKAGWLVKGRSGWTITDDGLRATVAFPDPDSFAAALANGTPVPADMPVPTAAPKRAAAAKRQPKRAARSTKESKTAAGAPAAVAPAVEPGPDLSAAPQTAASDVEPALGPDAVAIVGDFNVLLGASQDWAPQADETQMEWDPQERLWTLTAELPAGFYRYKAAINRSWDENYGAFGVRDGADHELHHSGGPVTFRYDHRTGDVSTT
jgi:hypothetical protein